MSLPRFFKLAERLAADSIIEKNHVGRRASIAAIFKIVPKSPYLHTPINDQNLQISNKQQLKDYFAQQP